MVRHRREATTSAPATAAQVERIGELYDSRVVPETKKRDPATMSERNAKRWIGLLEAYPLKEETVQGMGGRSANGAKPRGRKGTGTRVTDEELAARQEAEAKRQRGTRPRGKAQPAEQPAKTKRAKVERKPVDAKLAQRVVTMRAKLDAKGKPTAWAKIGYASSWCRRVRRRRRLATLPAAPTAR